MRIGVPREIKNHEYRVGLVPMFVSALTKAGHQVLVETCAGEGSGYADLEYQEAGAMIVEDAGIVFGEADMVVKVKEPLKKERAQLRTGQILFAYLNLAPDLEQTTDLMRSGATCITYETVTDTTGGLPLLAPMSEVAGRLAPQVGAASLQKKSGGRGILLGGVPGVPPAHTVVLGGGVSGSHAAAIAIGMGSTVSVMDRSLDVLRRLDQQFSGRVRTLFSTPEVIQSEIARADLTIGTVLIPGAAAPKLIQREMLRTMPPGAVIVDVSIDQGGCCETSRPTTHDNPTYIIDGIVHYCVTNMPGAVSRTSTLALNNATFPFVLALANQGRPPPVCRTRSPRKRSGPPPNADFPGMRPANPRL